MAIAKSGGGGSPKPVSDGVAQARADAAAAKAAAQRKQDAADAIAAKKAAEAKAAKEAANRAAQQSIEDKRLQKPPSPTSTPPPGGVSDDKIKTYDEAKDTPIDTTPVMSPQPTPVYSPPDLQEVVVKTPTRNITDISSLVPQLDPKVIQQLLFENLSAIELSIIERHDTIEGINQKYSIISNLSEVKKRYESSKQLTAMDRFSPLSKIFTIKTEDKIPQEDYLIKQGLDKEYQYLDENNQVVNRKKGYYYIDTNGDLVIELVDLEKNQQVELQIDTAGIIYKVEL